MKFCLTDFHDHSRREINWRIVWHWLKCPLRCCCWKIFAVGFDVPSPYWQLCWWHCRGLLYHGGVHVRWTSSNILVMKMSLIIASSRLSKVQFSLTLSKCYRIVPQFHPFSVSSKRTHSDRKWCFWVVWKLFPSFPKVWELRGRRCYHVEIFALKDVFLPSQYWGRGVRQTSVHIATMVFRHKKHLPPWFSGISIPIGASTDYCGIDDPVPFALLHPRWPFCILARLVVVLVLVLVGEVFPTFCSPLQGLEI